jgi:hypothetical protein
MSEQIVPLPLLYFTDASGYYDQELVKKSGGKIFDVYLFDANLLVSCCSLTPSYEMEFFEAVPLKGPEEPQYRDELEDDLVGANLGEHQVKYFDCVGWLKANTGADAVYPEAWDYQTAPFLLRVNGAQYDTDVAADWAECLSYHDGDYREAHRQFMEDTRDDIQSNYRY